MWTAPYLAFLILEAVVGEGQAGATDGGRGRVETDRGRQGEDLRERRHVIPRAQVD